MINLEKTIVRDIKYTNRMANNTTIDLKSSIKYESNYNSKERKSLGKIFLKIGNEEEKQAFFLGVEFHGVFKVNGEYEADFVSDETYKILYPHLQAYISAVTALSGVPPLPLPNFPIEK